MSKQTGLAAFTKKNPPESQDDGTEKNVASNTSTKKRRGRGKGETVALTVRLPRSDWERVHQLAVSEGVSIQSLAVDGLSKIFAEKGLPILNA